MAEVVLKNIGEIKGLYDGEETEFSTNEVSTIIISGITATKTADKTHWVNGPLVYTIEVKNETEVTLTGTTFTDVLDPALITLDLVYGVLVNGAAATYSFVGGNLSVTLPDIEEGETVTITFRVLQA